MAFVTSEFSISSDSDDVSSSCNLPTPIIDSQFFVKNDPQQPKCLWRRTKFWEATANPWSTDRVLVGMAQTAPGLGKSPTNEAVARSGPATAKSARAKVYAKIGRASCRERVYIAEVAGLIKE